MKGYLLSIATILILATYSHCQTFYNQLFGFESCRNCYFVVINLKSNVYTGPSIIETDDLLAFLAKKRGLSPLKSRDYARSLLQRNKWLQANDASLSGHGFFVRFKGSNDDMFRIVKKSEEVDKIASKGCVSFIQYYFLNALAEKPSEHNDDDCKEFIVKQKRTLQLERKIMGIRGQNAIIRKLFQWHIPTRIDDISGLLTIDRS